MATRTVEEIRQDITDLLNHPRNYTKDFRLVFSYKIQALVDELILVIGD